MEDFRLVGCNLTHRELLNKPDHTEAFDNLYKSAYLIQKAAGRVTQDNLAEKEKYLENALKLDKKFVAGKAASDDLDFLIKEDYLNLTQLYDKSDRPEKADEMRRKMIEIDEKVNQRKKPPESKVGE